MGIYTSLASMRCSEPGSTCRDDFGKYVACMMNQFKRKQRDEFEKEINGIKEYIYKGSA